MSPPFRPVSRRLVYGSVYKRELLATHLIAAEYLRADAFDTYFAARRESLCQLVEAAIGKAVQRDIDQGFAQEDSSQFEPDELSEGTAMEDN